MALEHLESRGEHIRTAVQLQEKGEFSSAADIYRELGEEEKVREMADLDRKLKKAKGYETALNYEKATELYEELEMWEDAKRCREKLSAVQSGYSNAAPPLPRDMQHYAPINKEYVQNIYSANASEKKPPSFDFGDFFSYKILHKIGSGGFSDVYAVERNGRRYAMKIPKGVDLSGSDTLELKEKDLEGYGKEAEIWAMLTEREPQAVVNLVDAGIRPFPWFVMEIGERKLGDAVGTASPQEKLRIISELLGKLDRIHHYGVVHKDIKPDNILFAGGNWKFTDFGLSKVLSMSSKSSAGFSGTMFYIAPEQVSKKHFGNTDWRTDIWQMGVLAYEVLTGHTPFEAEDAFEITSSILHNEPIPGTRYGMDERVWNVVKKALKKRKEERWQSASEFRSALWR